MYDNNNKSLSTIDSFWNESNTEGLKQILDFVRDITGEMKKREEESKKIDESKKKNNPSDGTFDVIEALGLDPEDFDYSDANEIGVLTWISSRNEGIIVTSEAYDTNNHMPELIYRQGKAYDDFKGTCGLCSTANAVRLLRVGNPTEAEVIDYAAENGYCEAEDNDDPSQPYMNGGTTNEDRIHVAEHYGLYAKTSDDFNLENWFGFLAMGFAITFTVYAEFLSKDVPEKMGRKVTSNHCITLIGLRFNYYEENDSFDIKEVIVLDTGGWINNKYGVAAIPIEKFKRMLKVTQYASYNINMSKEALDETM